MKKKIQIPIFGARPLSKKIQIFNFGILGIWEFGVQIKIAPKIYNPKQKKTFLQKSHKKEQEKKIASD